MRRWHWLPVQHQLRLGRQCAIPNASSSNVSHSSLTPIWKQQQEGEGERRHAERHTERERENWLRVSQWLRQYPLSLLCWPTPTMTTTMTTPLCDALCTLIDKLGQCHGHLAAAETSPSTATATAAHRCDRLHANAARLHLVTHFDYRCQRRRVWKCFESHRSWRSLCRCWDENGDGSGDGNGDAATAPATHRRVQEKPTIISFEISIKFNKNQLVAGAVKTMSSCYI